MKEGREVYEAKLSLATNSRFYLSSKLEYI